MVWVPREAEKDIDSTTKTVAPARPADGSDAGDTQANAATNSLWIIDLRSVLAGDYTGRGAGATPGPLCAMLEPLPLPKSRLEALTDGIFAVTMTLLVLDLKLPEHVGAETSQVVASLLRLLPHIDDYVISFIVLCLYWLAHLRLLQRVRDVDGAFVWLNLGFLLCTTFVPPLTSLIGNNPSQPVAAIVYGGNLLALLLFEALMWRRGALHLSNETVVDGAALWDFMRRRFLFAGGVILLAIVAALVEIEVGTKVGYASYVYLLLIVVGIVRARHAPSTVRHRHPPGP